MSLFYFLMGRFSTLILRYVPDERLHFNSIRNYMSKPWFLKMALEAEPSPLANRIATILQKAPSKGPEQERS